MALAPGVRLGPYEVLSRIGAGGMGEVWKARDTKLNRDVALKVLPEAFTLDAERIARLTREAQVLASLNHSNIAAIHGFEDGSAAHVLVLELVEGAPALQASTRSRWRFLLLQPTGAAVPTLTVALNWPRLLGN